MKTRTISAEVPAVPFAPRRQGLVRIWFAFKYSLAGIRAGWNEPAFRQESVLAALLLPAAPWIGTSWVETSVLAAAIIHVLVIELLNTAIERTVDRVGPEWHRFSEIAKDTASAAVFLSILLAGGIWTAAIVNRFS